MIPTPHTPSPLHRTHRKTVLIAEAVYGHVHRVSPRPARSPIRGSASRDVGGQEVYKRYRRLDIRAKMRAVVGLRAEEVDAMNASERHVTCHRYGRQRSSRTGGATYPISATANCTSATVRR